ncbi:MAG: LPS assembly lipoprotein LptE [Pseudomonas sp.]|uniref:LPS-assembly lipoprotein LptE n=1 Tax=Pseudomonas abieticivorans TaxID=2931382 RepID=UPI0020BD9119|nr:LPS assembly lipoprotein LptE [Pseudomonas sp. PIA16]MDE1166774.1 LPS assembly lipoprotein LptE [Pseudomonas sp.]
MIKRNLLVMGLAVMLSACGFQLRGTGTNQMSIKEIGLTARDAYGPTVTDLRRALESSGVKVVGGGPYKLNLSSEVENQRAASYTGSTRSAEYELSTVLNYEINGTNNLQLVSDKVEAQKIYLHDGNNLTGSDQEAAQARKDLRRDLIQKMMARLQKLTPAQLDELQTKADARAKAEADAEAAAQRAMDATPQQSPVQLPSR